MTRATTTRERPAGPCADAKQSAEVIRLYATKNDLPEAARREVVALLNQRLADCIDLEAQCKQAHWNVKGPGFIALHRLFDDVHGSVGEYADLLAERVVQLGGIAEGTVGIVAGRSCLLDYPLTLSTGPQHVAALADALSQFGRTVRIGIEEMNELEDAVSSDVVTEISRGVDKWPGWSRPTGRRRDRLSGEEPPQPKRTDCRVVG